MSALPVENSPHRIGSRGALRVQVDVMIEARCGQDPMLAHLLDVSHTGCRLTTQARLPADETIWVKLPMIAPQEARVVWNQGFISGCVFIEPLHPAVFQVVTRTLQQDAPD